MSNIIFIFYIFIYKFSMKTDSLLIFEKYKSPDVFIIRSASKELDFGILKSCSQICWISENDILEQSASFNFFEI